MNLYKVYKGKDIAPVGKSALYDRANKIFQKGGKAKVIKSSSGQFDLYVDSKSLKSAGLSTKDRRSINYP